MPPKLKIRDHDNGWSELLEAAQLGAAIEIGIHDPEASKKHPMSDTGMTIGEMGYLHEFGMGGQHRRSFLRAWIDQNQQVIREDMASAVKKVLSRKVSRKDAMEKIGFKWTKGVRDYIFTGKVRPKTGAAYAARKGHDKGVLESGEIANSITFKLRLRQVKSIPDSNVREAVRQGPK